MNNVTPLCDCVTPAENISRTFVPLVKTLSLLTKNEKNENQKNFNTTFNASDSFGCGIYRLQKG